MNAALLRYGDDDPPLHGLGLLPETNDPRPLLHGLSQNVRVSDAVLPAVHRAVTAARANLHLAGALDAFVYAHPEVNALCAPGASAGSLLVFISSAAVKLLSGVELTFVVGHEIGHFLFGHLRYPRPEPGPQLLQSLELRRASELSADRAGLMACGDIDAAMAALLKVASGLDTAHLEIDLSHYLAQARELGALEGDESMLLATHPSLPIRARALLRFDSVRQRGLDGEPLAASLREVDGSIRRELDRVVFGASGGRQAELSASSAFWLAAARVCAEGELTEHAQRRMAEQFGAERLAHLKRTLAGQSRAEVRRFLQARVGEAELRLAQSPLCVRRQVELRVTSVLAGGTTR